MTHRYCGSAVMAFMWNMPAGWWEVKCSWTRNTGWYTRTTEPKNRRVNAQPRTQSGSRTNLGSEICNNLSHYVPPNVCAWICILECVLIYVCICLCICVIITMCAHVTHLWHFFQVLPHAELMPSINSACIYQVKPQQLAACKLLPGYLCKFPKLTAYE